MAKSALRIRAVQLRRRGESIKQIAQTLGVSVSTVSVWCREVALSKIQVERLRQKQITAGHRGRLLGAQRNHERYLVARSHEEHVATTMVGKLQQRDKLLLGIGLYWGEGTKTRNSTTSIVNNNPEILRFMRDWFLELGVSKGDFRPYISITTDHRPREREILKYWSKTLAIPREQFGAVVYLPVRHKKVYENHDLYYGSVALRVRKSTRLKYRILGLIKACTPLPG